MRDPNDDDLRSQLEAGLTVLGLSWTSDQVTNALAYLRLLRRWNRAFNLTSVETLEGMIAAHLLDSLSVARFVTGSRVLDVGTGAGLPGIPLAIAHPEKRFFLLDSNGKKIRFIRQVVIELRLANVESIQSRVTDYRPDAPFDQIISRAFTSLEDFRLSTQRLCKRRGELLAMKGRLTNDEVDRVEPNCSFRVERLAVPRLDAERHLVIIPV